MSARDILSIFYTNSETLTPVRIIVIMLLSTVLGLIIWFTYRHTADLTVYSRSFGISNLIMALLTTIVMLMIDRKSTRLNSSH